MFIEQIIYIELHFVSTISRINLNTYAYISRFPYFNKFTHVIVKHYNVCLECLSKYGIKGKIEIT